MAHLHLDPRHEVLLYTVTVNMDIALTELRRNRGGGRGGRGRNGGLWVLVIAEASKAAHPGRQAVLAAKKVTAFGRPPRKDGEDVKATSHQKSVKIEIGTGMNMYESCFVEVLSDFSSGTARKQL